MNSKKVNYLQNLKEKNPDTLKVSKYLDTKMGCVVWETYTDVAVIVLPPSS
jgi:hypothetical protein